MRADVLERHKQEWEELTSVDPLWAILTSADRRGGRWELAEFFDTGEAEIAEVLKLADDLGEPVRRERALGCGVGRLSRPLGERFRECVGLDISEGNGEARPRAERRSAELSLRRQRGARPRAVRLRLVRLRLFVAGPSAHAFVDFARAI